VSNGARSVYHPAFRCYTSVMPTVRQRHLLTETDDIARAIDAAAASYPGHSRADVLRKLVQVGADIVAEQRGTHRRAVLDHAGRYPNLYAPGYLDELREDWPE